MSARRDWHRAAIEAEQAAADARAQLAYEQSQRRQWEADYRAEHREYLDALEAAVKRVRKLHWAYGGTLSGMSLCDACQHPWPCQTIEAIDGEAGA